MPSQRVSYSDLEDAFQFASYEHLYWLDRHTGRILSYSDEARRAVEEGDLSDLPDWMNDQIEAAREVLRAFGELPDEDSQSSAAGGQSSVDDSPPGFDTVTQEADRDAGAARPNRYLRIEQIPPHEAFQFMSNFIDQVSDARAHAALSRAVAGNKPFRRFKDETISQKNKSAGSRTKAAGGVSTSRSGRVMKESK